MRYYFIAILMAITSCTGLDNDYGPGNVNETPQSSVPVGVIILNEGNFQLGNASVDVFDKTTGSISRSVFQSSNDRPLGDIAQSMLIDADTGYIVINNSGKVEKVLLPSMESIGTLDGLSSPRYMIKIDDNKAYISDFLSGRISVIHPTFLTTIKEIETSGWTEKMFRYDNWIYVQSISDSGMYIIDALQDLVIGFVSIPDLIDVTMMDHRELACLTKGGLSILDMANAEVFPVAQANRFNTFSRIDYNPISKQVYVLSGNLLQYSLNSHELDTLYFS
jgi:DNA-binding beta-propeller fold protein YncE